MTQVCHYQKPCDFLWFQIKWKSASLPWVAWFYMIWSCFCHCLILFPSTPGLLHSTESSYFFTCQVYFPPGLWSLFPEHFSDFPCLTLQLIQIPAQLLFPQGVPWPPHLILTFFFFLNCITINFIQKFIFF